MAADDNLQEPANNSSAVRCYLARWALRTGEAEHIAAFAPASALPQKLLTWLPVRVLMWLRRTPLHWLLAKLFLRSSSSDEITDGNVNFSHAVRGRGGKALFVKQACGFLKWQPQMVLERARMAREVKYFEHAAAALGGGSLAARFLPRIHDFDAANSVIVMEYLSEHKVLFDVLFSRGHRRLRAAAEGLAEYLGRVAARTMSPAKPKDAASAAAATALAVEFWNPLLRTIQEEHVYTICFERSDRGRELAEDPALMAEVSLLKAKYLGYGFDERDRWALCHGDLHPGGVMASGADVKIIDPEFVQYGPPGLDLGSLMSGFILAFIYHALGLAPPPEHGKESPPAAEVSSELDGGVSNGGASVGAEAEELLEALRAMWARLEEVLMEEGVEAKQIARIGEDGVGFAMMEVLRTSLGFAGARDPARRISDPKALDRYQQLAVGLVRQCLLRRRAHGMGVLFEQLEMVGQSCAGWREASARRKASEGSKKQR